MGVWFCDCCQGLRDVMRPRSSLCLLADWRPNMSLRASSVSPGIWSPLQHTIPRISTLVSYTAMIGRFPQAMQQRSCNFRQKGRGLQDAMQDAIKWKSHLAIQWYRLYGSYYSTATTCIIRLLPRLLSSTTLLNKDYTRDDDNPTGETIAMAALVSNV